MNITIKDPDNRWIYVRDWSGKIIYSVKLTQEGWKQYCKNITPPTSASFDWSWAEIVMDYKALERVEL